MSTRLVDPYHTYKAVHWHPDSETNREGDREIITPMTISETIDLEKETEPEKNGSVPKDTGEA